MNAQSGAIIAVQAAVSVLLLALVAYLLVSGGTVPEWLVNLLLLVVGSWFAVGTVVAYRGRPRGDVPPAATKRLDRDGHWRSLDID